MMSTKSNMDPGLINKATYSQTNDAKIVTRIISQRFVSL